MVDVVAGTSCGGTMRSALLCAYAGRFATCLSADFRVRVEATFLPSFHRLGPCSSHASTSRGVCMDAASGGEGMGVWMIVRCFFFFVAAAHVRGCGGGTGSQHAGIRCLRSFLSAELRCAKAASVIAWCLRPPLIPSAAPRGAALHCLRRVRVMTTYLAR